jgi:hypothetical protein
LLVDPIADEICLWIRRQIDDGLAIGETLADDVTAEPLHFGPPPFFQFGTPLLRPRHWHPRAGPITVDFRDLLQSSHTVPNANFWEDLRGWN